MGTQNGYGIKIFPNKEIVVSGLFKKGPIRDEGKKIPPEISVKLNNYQKLT